MTRIVHPRAKSRISVQIFSGQRGRTTSKKRIKDRITNKTKHFNKSFWQFLRKFTREIPMSSVLTLGGLPCFLKIKINS